MFFPFFQAKFLGGYVNFKAPLLAYNTMTTKVLNNPVTLQHHWHTIRGF